MYQDFYALFMTDPFMNTLFDMKENELNHKGNGRRLGLFMLQQFGDDDEYSTFRPSDPMKNVGDAHVRSKNCPLRGKYQGKSFTINQMYTWVGYQHMAMEKRNFKD